MAKNNFIVKPSDFKKLLTTLKKIEKSDSSFKIAGLLTSNFLLGATHFEDQSDSPDIRTKRIILQIAGDFDTDPGRLADSINLKTNLLYSDDEYSILHMRLNKLVKSINRSASIDDEETGDCKTVKNCIDLVNSKIS